MPRKPRRSRTANRLRIVTTGNSGSFTTDCGCGAPDIVAMVRGRHIGIRVKDVKRGLNENQIAFQRELEKRADSAFWRGASRMWRENYSVQGRLHATKNRRPTPDREYDPSSSVSGFGCRFLIASRLSTIARRLDHVSRRPSSSCREEASMAGRRTLSGISRAETPVFHSVRCARPKTCSVFSTRRRVKFMRMVPRLSPAWPVATAGNFLCLLRHATGRDWLRFVWKCSHSPGLICP